MNSFLRLSVQKPRNSRRGGRRPLDMQYEIRSYGTDRFLLSLETVISAELISGLLKRHAKLESLLANSLQPSGPGSTIKPAISKSRRRLISYSVSPYGLIITITKVCDSPSATIAKRPTTLSLAVAGQDGTRRRN